jgi:hypothetical protein
MLVRSVSLAAIAVATVTASGCTFHSRQAQIEDVGAPGLTAPQYKIVGNVSATASDSVISPSVAQALTGQTVIDSARIKAVGAAIYDNDEIDMIIAPKVDAKGMDIGIFAQAEVTIKGKGVALIGPK